MINYYSRKNGQLGLFKEANNYGCEDMMDTNFTNWVQRLKEAVLDGSKD